MKPLVAIVGRPNVGKSTLFNRLLGRRRAITRDEPGTTRDLNYADCEEGGKLFTLVDTGGFEAAAKTGILKQVKEQARLAMEEADIIVFVMDGRTGPATGDGEIVDILRKTGKPVIYAVNKIDTKGIIPNINEFYSLGIDNIFPVSAEHGLGVGELLDCVLEKVAKPPAEALTPSGIIKVAIVGRPNAGKSSLLNRLIGKPRSIVSAEPGTTRDSIDTLFNYGGASYLFIDTAGIRKKSRISRTLEKYCVVEAIKSIERSDFTLLVVDGIEGLKGQDETIAGLIEDRAKTCVIVVNKWDLVEKDTNTTKLYTERIREEMPFLAYAPLMFVSALTGQRVTNIFKMIEKLVKESELKFPTSKLNSLLESSFSRHRPPAYMGKEVKFYYITQTGARPQRFTVFANHPEGITKSYRRYLVNCFREELKLENVPIRIFFRQRH